MPLANELSFVFSPRFDVLTTPLPPTAAPSRARFFFCRKSSRPIRTRNPPTNAANSHVSHFYVTRVTQDTLGFAGMKMIRRVVGISHVEDLDGIKDKATRARCESHALALGKRLTMFSENLGGKSDGDSGVAKVGDVCDLARLLGRNPSGTGAAASEA